MPENVQQSNSEATQIHREILLARETAQYLLHAIEAIRSDDPFTLRSFPERVDASYDIMSVESEYDVAVFDADKSIRERRESLSLLATMTISDDAITFIRAENAKHGNLPTVRVGNRRFCTYIEAVRALPDEYGEHSLGRDWTPIFRDDLPEKIRPGDPLEWAALIDREIAFTLARLPLGVSRRDGCFQTANHLFLSFEVLSAVISLKWQLQWPLWNRTRRPSVFVDASPNAPFKSITFDHSEDAFFDALAVLVGYADRRRGFDYLVADGTFRPFPTQPNAVKSVDGLTPFIAGVKAAEATFHELRIGECFEALSDWLPSRGDRFESWRRLLEMALQRPTIHNCKKERCVIRDRNERRVRYKLRERLNKHPVWNDLEWRRTLLERAESLQKELTVEWIDTARILSAITVVLFDSSPESHNPQQLIDADPISENSAEKFAKSDAFDSAQLDMEQEGSKTKLNVITTVRHERRKRTAAEMKEARQAAELMMREGKTLDEIAMALGYANASGVSKLLNGR